VQKTLPVSHPDLRALKALSPSRRPSGGDPAAFEATLPKQAAMPKTLDEDKVNAEESRGLGGEGDLAGLELLDEVSARLIDRAHIKQDIYCIPSV
jgi:hypothetical protein